MLYLVIKTNLAIKHGILADIRTLRLLLRRQLAFKWVDYKMLGTMLSLSPHYPHYSHNYQLFITIDIFIAVVVVVGGGGGVGVVGGVAGDEDGGVLQLCAGQRVSVTRLMSD